MVIYYYSELDSTNNEAKRKWASLPVLPSVIVAGTQSQGRGQFSKRWFSASPDGIYMTYVTQPEHFDFHLLPIYQMRVGEVISHILLDMCGIHATVKAPNDIMIDSKKVAGVLVEAVTKSSQTMPSVVMIGIGINVNHREFPHDLQDSAISLAQKSTYLYNKDAIIVALSKELEHVFERD